MRLAGTKYSPHPTTERIPFIDSLAPDNLKEIMLRITDYEVVTVKRVCKDCYASLSYVEDDDAYWCRRLELVLGRDLSLSTCTFWRDVYEYVAADPNFTCKGLSTLDIRVSKVVAALALESNAEPLDISPSRISEVSKLLNPANIIHLKAGSSCVNWMSAWCKAAIDRNDIELFKYLLEKHTHYESYDDVLNMCLEVGSDDGLRAFIANNAGVYHCYNASGIVRAIDEGKYDIVVLCVRSLDLTNDRELVKAAVRANNIELVREMFCANYHTCLWYVAEELSQWDDREMIDLMLSRNDVDWDDLDASIRHGIQNENVYLVKACVSHKEFVYYPEIIEDYLERACMENNLLIREHLCGLLKSQKC